MPGSFRWTYESHRHEPLQGLEELEMFGLQDNTKATDLGKHLHHQGYEFVFIEKGKATWELDGEHFSTSAGDLFHTCPEEVHSGSYNVIDPCRMWWMILSVPSDSDVHRENWLRLSREEGDLIARGIRQLPRIVRVGSRLIEPFRRMKQALDKRDLLTSLKIRQGIIEFLLILLQQDSNKTASEEAAQLLDGLNDRMKRDWTWRPSVSELAESLGFSPSHFYRVFRELTGLSPISYMERLRIEEARRRLQQSDEKITEMAHQLGYASSQHFATAFRRFMGKSPTIWRRINEIDDIVKSKRI
jgi:AraC-like DNA-binding protein